MWDTTSTSTSSLAERAPLLEALRLLAAGARDVAGATAPDPIFGMTLHQAFLFQRVLSSGGITIAALTETAYTTHAAVSQMVTRMEDNGHVRRVPHPRDGRCRLIVPTAKGERAFACAAPAAVSAAKEWESLAGRHMRRGTDAFESYVAAGVHLWRWSRGLGPSPYGVGWVAS